MKVSQLQFQVRPSEVDRNKRIRLSSLLNYLQEVAWHNANVLDAGVEQLQAAGVSWVLIRLKLEIDRLPRLGEEMRIESWPSGSERTFVYRDYRVYDAFGERLASATSTWLVLDLQTRRMISLPANLQQITQAPQDVEAMPRAKERFQFPSGERLEVSLPVRWHDLDANEHVSNFLYFQWALEAMPLAHLQEQELSYLDLMIRAEALYGDTVISSSVPGTGPNYYHQITRKGDGRELARARSQWR